MLHINFHSAKIKLRFYKAEKVNNRKNGIKIEGDKR